MKGISGARISKSTSQAGSRKTVTVRATNGKQTATSKVTIKK